MSRIRAGQSSRQILQNDDDEDSSPDGSQQPQRRTGTSRVENGSSNSEFQPGAIVRVKLRNFVTYEEAEFFLGPNLNMVIGPNGTGKSSLVCAICLGLGYSSSVLGRASAFGEFVKHGSDQAEIEVELQRKPEDTENYVVGLCIRREDNGRKFTINGQRATHKDVQKLMHLLRIQIDNLCQFLPQDKVAEFAGLSAVELLEKTLLAAAPQEMIEWQAQLKESYRSQKDAQVSTEKTREEVCKMEARQQVLQADVDKLRQRKEIQKELEVLDGVRILIAYNEARETYKKAKKDRVAAKRSLQQLQEDVAPSLQAVNRKQEYRDQIKAVVEVRQRQLRTAEGAADDALNEVEAASSRASAREADIQAETARFTSERQKKAKIVKRITELKARYQQKPREFKAGEWNTRTRELDHLQRDKLEEIKPLKTEMDRLVQYGKDLKEEVAAIGKEVTKLSSQEGQLVSQLQKINPEVARGWDWLKDHQDEFEKPVFGPPMLTCSVKDKRYSDLIQSLLAQNDFLCFTVQTRSDHKKLSNRLYKELGLSVSIRTSEHPLDSYKSQIPKEQLAGFGFEGYAVDFLDGPEPVLAMLCNEKRLHTSPLALRDLSDEQYARVEQGQSISNFAAGSKQYRIIRRREYEGAVSTRVGRVQRGRFWSDQPIDGGEKEELIRKSHERKAQFEETVAKAKETKQLLRKAEEELSKIHERMAEVDKEKTEIQHAFNKWNALPDQIEREEKDRDRCNEELRASRERQSELRKVYEKAQLETARAIIQHANSIGRLRKARQALLEAQVILLEAESDVAVLKFKSAEVTQRLEEARNALAEHDKTVSKAKDAAVTAGAEWTQKGTDATEEQAKLAKELNLDKVKERIGIQESKLDLIQASNPLALEEYERYAAKIAREKSAQENQETRLAAIEEKIREVRGQWEPRLDELVSRINDAFSYNFEQISCAGEVGVHKDEDFDKWAIEIMVKFRENETLQRLDQHRQSGGERAVSTIFYLMALQSIAQAPFRVVDEINQGMDPRNERMVHERMVEVACREHTSQYFLITPKLLSGLRYDERMRVHTIVSGEHVDKDGTEKMNFTEFVKIQKALKGY